MAKQDERRREVLVGVFVLAAISAAMVMIVMVGSEQRIFERRFRLRAVFGTVSGLRIGAPVFVAGVNVGSVDRIKFVPSETVQISPTPATPEPGAGARRVGNV